MTRPLVLCAVFVASLMVVAGARADAPDAQTDYDRAVQTWKTPEDIKR